MTRTAPGFADATSSWLAAAFDSPTRVQHAAWQAIGTGEHTLVVAPTGSGKTLAAFLHWLDRLAFQPRRGKGTRVVYVSPLKALGVDVERNLEPPLAGLARHASELGTPFHPVTVGIRSGDTSARERARLRRTPPDVLITTPESLYLMLTSSARETLRDVEAVIIDEIHAIAGNKRGTHLALSLERLDLLVGRDVQRIALSATVRPIDAIARFLGGDRDVTVVAPETTKDWDVAVRTAPLTDPWPTIHQRLLDDILTARSTLVFTNARRTAETLTGRLNELWVERGGDGHIARAHHGSVSKHLREEIESDLKQGRLRAVVATATLELGIDMGAVEQVIQVGAPPSVSSALQRVGRAGHQVGATSRGRIEVLHRGELAAAVVATGDLLGGRIEQIHVPEIPLDVLAQQTVAEAAVHPETGLDVGRWLQTCRRSHPYRQLTHRSLDDVLTLLLGTYPSADFAELRARLALRDGRLFPLRGAGRLALTSGGTIPDRGLYTVLLDDAEGPGRRVGELDEEMVHETRVGETFTLGASSWTIVAITRDHVRVVPAPALSGQMPFWRSEEPSRPAELGRRIGELNRRVASGEDRLEVPWIDETTRAELLSHVQEQAAATGIVPDDGTVVVERCRDELGDWRVIVHCPLGRAVLMPWAVAMAAAVEECSGVDARPIVADDAIILRLPDGHLAERIVELVHVSPQRVEEIVVARIATTGQFAARFREAAARSLVLPRRIGRRMPLWQQRNRAAQLHQVARWHPRFPITVEAVRELLHDEWDLPALKELLQHIAWGRHRVVAVETTSPSPFAASLLHRYAAAFMYEGDLPVGDRGGTGIAVDSESLEAIGLAGDPTRVLDEAVVERMWGELQHTLPGRRARNLDELIELPRRLGPLTREELASRSEVALPAELPADWAEIDLAGVGRIIARSDLPLFTGAPGQVPGRDPMVQLVDRFARTRTPFRVEELTAALAIDHAVAEGLLDAEVSAGRMVRVRVPTAHGVHHCDAAVWRRLVERSLAAARARVTPLPGRAYARFLLTEVHRIGSCDSVLEALGVLAGTVLPASEWESHLLPSRCPGYQPRDLDLLLARGAAAIRVLGPGEDPPIAIMDARDLDLLPPRPEPGAESREFAARLGDGLIPASRAEEAWAAAAAGTIAPGSMDPLRALLGRTTRVVPTPRPTRRRIARPLRPAADDTVLPGRWYAVSDEPAGAEVFLAQWLGLFGLVTRPVATGLPGGWSAVYRDLRQLEAQGVVDRGVFVEGLGPAQFAPPDFIQRTAPFREPGDPTAHLLAARDPANAFGLSLAWPPHAGARPTRSSGSFVVISDGECLAHLARGLRTLTLFQGEEAASRVVACLVTAVTEGRLKRFRIEEINGERATAHPLHQVMRQAGARIHPQGLVIEP
ncbi:MAG: DEAD/DEAH box helicase [Arachnia propionica]|uniref:DEAD/DEAH box helicase n=1 Tax=Arachnia propionica TaxID=1750 RepID=UPI00270D4FAF|nr:DEAD/DEAH box helicase [Arachnia propionica]